MSNDIDAPNIPPLNEYEVTYVNITEVHPSPENDMVYGVIAHDEQMNALIASIETRGLEEPIIVSLDDYIISGHRRYYACEQLEMDRIPVRYKCDLSREKNLDEWPRILAEYNPQRIKPITALLRESLMRHSDNPLSLIKQHVESFANRASENAMVVSGSKSVGTIPESKREFLESAKAVVESLRDYWPITVRTVHYKLLNNPPLTNKPKVSKHGAESYRYKNDVKSYKSLVRLLTQARYTDEVSMDAIDDPTRPFFHHVGFNNVSEYAEQEIRIFLAGYHRDRQHDQPIHIEALIEKNTLVSIVKPVCDKLYIPLSAARGYGSVPVWRDMAGRYKKSGKGSMVLVIASDLDPEGLDLADDAIRTLKGIWGIDAKYHRVGVTQEQVDEHGIAEDFNAAKETSTRLKGFIKKTGSDRTWELEALPPEVIAAEFRKAIVSYMDVEIDEQTLKSERADAAELARIRTEIVSGFSS